jgi:hypothetical protein
VWQDVTIDLSAHKGQAVRLRFVFSTGDALYNNFRGWVIDQVGVRTGASLSSMSASVLGDPVTSATEELVPADQMVFPDRQEP